LGVQEIAPNPHLARLSATFWLAQSAI